MLFDLNALQSELPALQAISLARITDLLPSLGFPVDGIHAAEGRTVLDVDITANRGDVQSHRGLARDLAARLGEPLPEIPREALPEGAAHFPIRIEAEACALYASAILELGSRQATPPEVVAFLGSMGSNAKQLAAVDASNELLHRYGHPTHAFDAEALKGAIIVRWAKAGEKLVTLDGVERTLTPEDLLIADEGGPIALAGVIGGDATKVTATTRRVLLESAWFDPRVVRRMSRRHGVYTDASHRFGRGADPVMARVARDLLAARLQAWAGATLVGAWTVGQVPAPTGPVELSQAVLDRIAGEPVPLAEAADLLTRLGCTVATEGQRLRAEPPSWRHDLIIPEDLAEEVLRLRGFDRIGSALPPLQGAPAPLTDGYLQAHHLAKRLANQGFFQTVTLGFVSPEWDAAFAGADNPAEGRTLGNPLGVEYSVMRSSLLPSLKAVADLNRRQGAKEVRLFEMGPAYRSTPSGPREEMTLAVVWGGLRGGEDFLTPARPVQAADLIGIARDLGAPAGVKVLDLGEGLLGLEVALDTLPKPQARVIPSFTAFSRFPHVERDLSLLVDLGQPYAALEAAMAAAVLAAAGEAFQGLRCVDVFRHKSLPAGRQAWLVRLAFQAPDRTLTSEEVDAWVQAALTAAQGLGATLRQ